MLSRLFSQTYAGRAARPGRGALFFTLLLLSVEFLDELVFGVREAAWPLIRADLDLDYAQIGLLLGVPGVVANLIEPPIGVLGDVWKRRALVVGGGLFFALALLLAGGAPGFVVLLLAFILFYPASGAFVSLSQATLMDLAPHRHEQLMARWTLAGSLGVLAGPLLLGGALLLGYSWRSLFLVLAPLTLLLVFLVHRQPFVEDGAKAEVSGLGEGVREALRALRREEVLRWLILLDLSDLMGDVLLGFLALYFADVVGLSPALAGGAVAVLVGAGLVGNIVLIPLLERMPGLHYLRYSSALTLLLYPAFLLVPSAGAKLVLVGVIGFVNTGWYAVLQGRLYSALPGRSGTVMAIGSASGIVGALIAVLLGFVAEQAGLPTMMWMLALGPLALIVGLPRRST
ncbi:MAG: MFS transporter [Ardenticatenaceae bacterium]